MPAHARGELLSVAASSVRNAWAVGDDGENSLILHWNGTTWKRVPSPQPALATLFSVTAPSARTAIAAGVDRNDNPLILRWNGTTWNTQHATGVSRTHPEQTPPGGPDPAAPT